MSFRSPGLLLLTTLCFACASDDPPAPTPTDETTVLAVTLSPESLVLEPWAETATLTATVRNQDGAAVTGAALSWESLDPAVATVSATGVVQSVGVGTGRIRVSASRAGATSAQAEVAVQVVRQRNARCTPPGSGTRGTAAAAPTFGAPEVLTTLPAAAWDGARSLAADFDGDGDPDVVRLEYSYPNSKTYSGETRIFRNDAGVLTLATPQVLAAPVVPDHPRDFEVRDFTGDGVPDLYVAQHGFDATPFPGAPNLLLTRSGDKLANVAPSTFTPYVTTGFSHGSTSGDVDCDGDADLVELNLTSAATNVLFLNDGTGRFGSAPAGAVPTAQRWQEAAFIDFDTDGDPDLFLGARSGTGWNEDVLLVNDGSGRFRSSSAVRLPAPRYAPNHGVNNAKAADFDGDGREDLLLFEIPQPFSTSSALRLWRNKGDGSFEDVSQAWGLPAACSAELVEPLYVTDFNRDGWPDVAVPYTCPELGGPGLLINRAGTFQSVPFKGIVSWLEYDVVTPLDIDKDGDPDLFFGEHGGNPVLVRNPL